MNKTICILCQSFTSKKGNDFEKLQEQLSKLPKPDKPLGLIDKNSYLNHISAGINFLNLKSENLFQVGYKDLKELESVRMERFDNRDVFLDENKEIELDLGSIIWIFVLDSKNEFGMLYYTFELKVSGYDSLKTLAENRRSFRMLKGGKRPNLKVFEKKRCVSEISFYNIFEGSFPKISNYIEILSPNPIQFHFLDRNAFSINSNKDSLCYNLLRIPSKSNVEIEKRFFENNSNHTFENTSLFSFLISEGAVLTAHDKSPKQLISKFLTSLSNPLFQKELTIFLMSNQANSFRDTNQNSFSPKKLEKLKKLRRNINLISLFGSLPVSQSSEIQSVYSLAKRNFLSGTDFQEMRGALDIISLILQEEAEQESNDRERKIGIILGVLGITGFISFIFDYLIISKNQKLIDTLDFPFNALPFLLFFITFIIIWRFLNLKNND